MGTRFAEHKDTKPWQDSNRDSFDLAFSIVLCLRTADYLAINSSITKYHEAQSFSL